jgi:hypothetical protein
MKNELHHLGQEKKKKSNSLQLKKYKISGGDIGKINQAYGTTDGLTPQQAFNKRKAAEAAAAAAAITQPVAAQNNQIVAAVSTALNNSTIRNNSAQVTKAVVNVAQAVAANVAINQQVTKNNNNKTKYIKILTSIRNGINEVLSKE